MTFFEQLNIHSEEGGKDIKEFGLESVKHPEIRELYEPIQHILEQVEDKIEKGEYGLIIGDDTSGRIPTLIFDNFFKALYKDKEYKEKGHIHPQTIFFAGSSGRRTAIEKVDAYVKEFVKEKIVQRKKNERGKALIVTDVIVSGKSLNFLTESLRNNHIEYDIATMGLLGRAGEDLGLLEKKLGSNIFYGRDIYEPFVYHKWRLSGVTRAGDEEVFAQKVVSSETEVRESREDVNIVANELVDWYKKEVNK